MKFTKKIYGRQMNNRSKYDPEKCKNTMANYRRLKKLEKNG